MSVRTTVGLSRRPWRLVGAASAIALVLVMAPVSSAAAAPVDPGDLTGQGLTSSDDESGSKATTSRLAQSDPAVLDATGTEQVPLLVKLDYDSVATYSGGVDNLQPTSPATTAQALDENTEAVQQYESYISGVEDAFVNELTATMPNAAVGSRLRTVFGGVSVSVPADQAKDLLKLPGVVAVQADELNQLLTDSSPGFIGAPTVYKALRKKDGTAGDGAIVGVLDSGAWPEHPSFADPGIGAPPAKADGTPRTCNFGDNPLTPDSDVYACNDKLISGEPFLKTYNATYPGAETYANSARDSNGHGTHTATTSAGSPVANAVVLGVDRGAVHGIAPGAHVAVYKVCGADGCFSSDSVSAVEQAIRDGVDVINFSISGGTQPFTDPVELAFFDAYAAGVFVATSAGNDGPLPPPPTTEPWVTTVAASTQQRAFQSTLTVQGVTRPLAPPVLRSPREPQLPAGLGRPLRTAGCAATARRRPVPSPARSLPANAAATPGSTRGTTSVPVALSGWCSTTRAWPTSRPTIIGCQRFTWPTAPSSLSS